MSLKKVSPGQNTPKPKVEEEHLKKLGCNSVSDPRPQEQISSVDFPVDSVESSTECVFSLPVCIE